ncbi:MAG: starch-binding protein [Prevotella sp.]|nr:starch-binding protein [Prevotella sp.]
MQRLYTTLIALIATISMMAQGWPANYDGVMLQGFYWDSYSDSKWTVLESQADELSQYFDLIWVPQSGYCNTLTMQMGYLPIWWFDHKSCFGTEAELRSMINTFKQKGTGIIEDVVINHRNGNTNWCDFPTETWNGKTMTWSLADICKTDECSRNGYSPTGAAESNTNETDFAGGRDLDHTSKHVQDNVKIYLDFLLNDLGYIGFRYDMVKGYAPKYTGMYNVSANPKFSVGEYWDQSLSRVKSWVDGTTVDGVIQSAAFDFPLKYKINNAFQFGNWSSLAEKTLTTTDGYARYSVTFADNHDTGKNPANTNDGPLSKNICAANAFILTMPGTPCLFLKHWMSNKGTLKRLIALRKAAGITNQSEILTAESCGGGFILVVQGSKGKLRLHVGPVGEITFNNPVDMWEEAIKGKNFELFSSKDVDLTTLKAITEEDFKPEDDTPFTIPEFCTVSEGEICAFFEAPSSWKTPIKCWRWDNQYNYTGNQWPGVTCTKIGDSPRGNSVWKWTFDASYKKAQSSPNQGIIFNDVQQINGTGNQTADLPFVNGGYYYQNDGLMGTVTPTAIRSVKTDSNQSSAKVYTLDGRLVSSDGSVDNLPKGVYITKGKKYILK